MAETRMIELALYEVKGLIDYYIDNVDSLDAESLTSAMHIVTGLEMGCGCSTENDHNCGCKQRTNYVQKALEEIAKLQKQIRLNELSKLNNKQNNAQ